MQINNSKECESMVNENTSKNSPFYAEYNGTTKGTKTYGYHVRKDFEKPLKEFFDARFGDATDSAIIEQIVHDYYFRYAHEQQSYGKTIIALLPKDESNGKEILPLLVLDRLPIDSENNLISQDMIANNPMLEYVAFIKSFKDCSDTVKKGIFDKLVNIGFEFDGYSTLKNLKHVDEDKLDTNFFIVEIPLNNHLDVKRNGVYCHENDNGDAVESMHVGLAIVKDNGADIIDAPMILVYSWRLKENLEIFVNVISIIGLNDFEELCQKYNYSMHVVLREFKRTDFSVDFRLAENKQKQDKLKAKLQVLIDEQKMLLELKNIESNGDD